MEQYQIDALLCPPAYPETTSSVKLLQTHISYLFLTDAHVYKFKKPVNFGFLDFTSLEQRRFYCNEELRLNRRLSPDIYLGIAELRQDKQGRLAINGNGEIIDYAVKMIRLPEQRMMARLLDRNEVTPAELSEIARLVAGFHNTAARGPGIDLFGSVEMIRTNWEENLQQVKPYLERTIAARTHDLIGTWAIKRLQDDETLFRERVANGFIRECDGDLHSENICLDDKVHIFDCIEFNEKFRYTDTAADVAFMVMDLENHGRRDLADLFAAEYIAVSGDRGITEVLPLYLANRAFIRGKVESFRLDDKGIAAEEKSAASTRAKRFFRLSRGYALREKLPLSLIMTCAPTGSGKSSMAAELAFQLGIEHFSTDIERKRLAGIAPGERGGDIYTPEWHRRTYQQLENLTREQLSKGASVIVDGTFIRRSDRHAFAALASAAGCDLVILRLHCPPTTVRQRMASRAKEAYSISDGNWEVYLHQSAALEEPGSAEGQVIEIDATLSPELMVEQVLEKLGMT